MSNWDTQKYLNLFLNISHGVKVLKSDYRPSVGLSNSIHTNLMTHENDADVKFNEIMVKAGLGNPRLKTTLHELKWYRNEWAHQKELGRDDINRLMETIMILMNVINYPKASEEYRRVHNTRLRLMEGILKNSTLI